MIFSDGDFIVLGIMFLVLFLFRRLDKNSKSLEKVRRYAEKVKGELDKIFQDKEQQMKDLSINFDVQEKTYREILSRVENARQELQSREEAITQLMGRLQGFDERINGLYQLTAKVDENMIRLRDESEYVDQLGLRLKDIKKVQDVLDQRMENLRESFGKKNLEQLETAKNSLVEDVQARFELISSELTRGGVELDRFQTALKEYRLISANLSEETLSTLNKEIQTLEVDFLQRVESQTEQVQAMENGLNQEVHRVQQQINDFQETSETLATQAMTKIRGDLDELNSEYQGYIQNAAEKGQVLENEIFLDLKDKIEEKSKNLEENWFQGMGELKEEVARRVAEIQGFIAKGDQGLSELQEQQQNQLEESTIRLQKLTSDLLSLEESMDRVQDGFSEARNQALDQLQHSQQELSESLEEQLAQRLDELRHQLENNSLESHQNLEEQILQYQQEISGKFLRFQEQWQDLLKQEDRMDDLLSGLTNRLDDLREQSKELTQENLQTMEEDLKQQIHQSGINLDSQLEQWQGTIHGRLESLEDQDKDQLRVLQDKIISESEKELNNFEESLYQNLNELKKSAENMTGELDSTVAKSQDDLLGLRRELEENILEYKSISREHFQQLHGDLEEFKEKSGGEMSQLSGSLAVLEDRIEKLKQGTLDSAQKRFGHMEENLQEQLNTLKESRSQEFQLWEEQQNKLLENVNENYLEILEELKESILGNASSKLGQYREEILEDYQDLQGKTQEYSVNMEQLLTQENHRLLEQQEQWNQRNLQISDSVENLEKSFSEIDNRLDQMKEGVLDSARERFSDIEEAMQNQLDNLSNTRREEIIQWQDQQKIQLDDLNQGYLDILEELKNSVENKAAAQIEEYQSDILTEYQSLKSKADQYSVDIDGVLSKEDQRLTEMQLQWKDQVVGLKLQSDEFSGSMKEALEELELLKTQYGMEVHQFQGGLQGRMDELTKMAELQIRQAMEQQNTLARELEQKTMKSIELRQQDYQATINGRFDKLESITGDLDELDNSLRLTLSEQETRMYQQLEQFSQNLKEKQDKEQQASHERLGDIRRIIGQVEGELNQLKTQAYENVSEKLQLFEDDFFSDLKSREEAMKDSFGQWQKSVDLQMEELNNQSQRDREELERNHQSQFKRRFNEIQARVLEQMNKFQEQVQGFQEQVVLQIEGSEKDFSDYRQGVKNQINQLKESSWETFTQEFAAHQESMDDLLNRSEREVVLKLEGMFSDIEGNRGELSALINSSRSDIDQWQKRVLVQLKNQQSDINNSLEDYRSQVDLTVEQIREDFLSQKEDLILKSSQERATLRQDLQQLTENVELLKGQMAGNSEKYITRMQEQGEEFLLELQGRTREVHGESDEKLRAIRQALQDTRDRIENLQKQLQGQAEEDYASLATNLEEMGRHQQEFIAQTHIFDQAENLKTNLDADLKELRSRMETIERSRQELAPMEEEYQRVMNSYQDVSGKINQFFSEKQKIDLLDSKVVKINNLSEAIDVKLEQIDNTNDMVQEYMVRIRQLEDLHNDIAKRYQGLEKKAGIVDATTNSVEKNLQMLGYIEKGLKAISVDLDPMKKDLATIKMSNQRLLEEKEKVDSMVSSLDNLDHTMVDLEQRQQRMEKAREWLANTETRLENIGREAQEKVKLLGSLVLKDNKKGLRTAGSPDMNTREMVVQLARQGWNTEEISRQVKLSRGEVELILELAPPEE
ncbi:MAG: hypothetical protein PF447_10355 [Spirochaetaceae bacterium]|jgi:DNA repair exonuclease SbcCD ATPase subunit|nr:hypothetical protein [Spirochaetaceae bacterium]